MNTEAPFPTHRVLVDSVSVTNKFPATDKFPLIVSPALLTGVYPRAVVMSDDDRENVAVRFDRPSLVRVRVLIVEAVSANEIAVT